MIRFIPRIGYNVPSRNTSVVHRPSTNRSAQGPPLTPIDPNIFDIHDRNRMMQVHEELISTNAKFKVLEKKVHDQIGQNIELGKILRTQNKKADETFRNLRAWCFGLGCAILFFRKKEDVSKTP
jgi:hypothetical protein